MAFEGGFQGRTNKLVDGCYSFWQGGTFPVIHTVLSKLGLTCISDFPNEFMQSLTFSFLTYVTHPY